MKFRTYAAAAMRLPPREVARRAAALLGRESTMALQRFRDMRHTTFIVLDNERPLRHYFPASPIELIAPEAEQIAGLAELYLSHYFNLLGSGWVQVTHGMACQGVEGNVYHSSPHGVNVANRASSARVAALIGSGYEPIDWHLDFKSGYRWSPAVWYLDIPYGHLPGVDIKVPWELARMQHLAILAWAFGLSRAGVTGFRDADAYAREFRNEVLDFISGNPPRYGVNWRTSMDVAIRVANWLVAFDLFSCYGAEFDPPFMRELAGSVYQHAQHIAMNLEWSPDVRGNHYLADIVGLLFAAAYLPSTAETDVWLAFATRELVGEVGHQFTPDGGNFEASTSYHRLSAEMVVYATALTLSLGPDKRDALRSYNAALHRGLPPLAPCPVPVYPRPGTERKSPFAPWYMERLERMAEFVSHCTKPTGRVPQIGDNDSGRFLKLWPKYERVDQQVNRTCWIEKDLDHRHVVATINGLFARQDFAAVSDSPETWIIRNMAEASCWPSFRIGSEQLPERVRVGSPSDWSRIVGDLEGRLAGKRLVTDLPVSIVKDTDDLVMYAYPDFGLYIYRSPRGYLCIRCGPAGQDGNGGHAHCDQLAIELTVDGQDRVRDPGTYLYTPLPARRNQFRSVQAHSSPRVADLEPEDLSLGLFRLTDRSSAEALYYRENGFIGRHHGYGYWLYRVIEIRSDSVRIIDYSEGSVPLRSFAADQSPVPFSPAYGVLESTEAPSPHERKLTGAHA